MKYGFVLILCSFFSLSYAKHSAESFFCSMPRNIFPYLTQDERVSLVTSLKSGGDFCMPSFLGSKVCLNVLTDSAAVIKTSSVGKTAINMMLSADSLPFFSVTKTVSKPVPSSIVKFYDVYYKELKNIQLEHIDILSFADRDKMKKDGFSEEKLLRKTGPLFVTYKNLDGKIFEAKLHIKEFLSEEVYSIIEPYIKTDVVKISAVKK